MKPENFSLGVIDFFSIMLPGAALTAVLMTDALPTLKGLFPAIESLNGGGGLAVFLFFSYLLGHFVFLVGGYLDDPVYDRIRRATAVQQEWRRQEQKSLASKPAKVLARFFFGKDPDLALQHVINLKKQSLPEVEGKPVVHAFQWARARLTAQCPLALAEVQRLEADSKFFRSIVVVLVIIIPWVCLRSLSVEESTHPFDRKWLVTIGIVLWLLSCWRYIERRFKATQQAYWHVITLEHLPSSVADAANREQER